MVITSTSPGPSPPRCVHRTFPVSPRSGCEHDQSDGAITRRKTVWSPTKSTIFGLLASLGPSLRIVIEYVIRWPARTGWGRLVLVTDRSARRTTSVCTVALLLEET